MNSSFIPFTALLFLCLSANVISAQSTEVYGLVQSDYQGFFKKGLYAGQKSHFVSFASELQGLWRISDRQRIEFKGFARAATQNDGRSHADIRDLFWRASRETAELRLGIQKIFWGVTESRHLVDILNQTDALENPDGEDKLGQPMVHAMTWRKTGTYEFFLLPFFRPREFVEPRGRFRTPLAIAGNQYESGAGTKHIDAAVRWSQRFGDADVSLSHFFGTGREPRFLATRDTIPRLTPFYDIIHQTGATAQLITGAMIWKAEATRRYSDFSTSYAAVVGFEYTWSNITRSGWDVGLLGEFLHDDRDSQTPDGLNHDIFVGGRWTLNDQAGTQILAGAIWDYRNGTRIYQVEGGRRFGEMWRVDMELRGFQNTSEKEILRVIRRDSYGQLSIARYF